MPGTPWGLLSVAEQRPQAFFSLPVSKIDTEFNLSDRHLFSWQAAQSF
jgi:hypothetical protein